MGVTVRQKIKGKGQPWWVFINHNGKRRSRKIGSKTAAKRIAAEIQQKIARQEFKLEREKPVPTFGEYSQKWLKDYVSVSCRESTLEEYSGILKNHVLPVFKDKPIDKVSRGDIRDFLLSKVKDFSRSRVGLFKDVLSGVLGYALDEELIPANPTLGITKRLFPKSNRTKKALSVNHVLNREELELFHNTCKSLVPEYSAFFTMAAKTGMRLGELLALRWDNVDFNSNFLWVKRSYRRGIFTRPKNGKSRRVDMTPQLKAVLKQHLFKEKKECLSLGIEPELVFSRYGSPIEQNFIRRVFKRVLKKAGLRDIKLHGLRHTYASILLSAGVSLFYVSKQLGHSGINITSDIYGHFIPSEGNREVDLLDSPAPTCTLSAPKALNSQKEKPQHVDIAVNSKYLVPKAGLEPARM